MTRRLFLPLFFAFLLALAQQEAMVHVYSHAADWQETSQHDKQVPHSSNCAKCVMYAGIAGAIGAKPLTVHALSSLFILWIGVLPVYLSATHLPYHSRAPPLLA